MAIDELLSRDIHLKELEFSEHEFIKTVDVGSMIQDALNQMMDKLNQRDKTIVGNKNAIRLHEKKLINLKQEVHALYRLQKQIYDSQSKQKQMSKTILENALRVEAVKDEIHPRIDAVSSR